MNILVLFMVSLSGGLQIEHTGPRNAQSLLGVQLRRVVLLSFPVNLVRKCAQARNNGVLAFLSANCRNPQLKSGRHTGREDR